jgi:hypothetical protein
MCVGKSVVHPILDVTPTLLNANTIDQLRRADKVGGGEEMGWPFF